MVKAKRKNKLSLYKSITLLRKRYSVLFFLITFIFLFFLFFRLFYLEYLTFHLHPKIIYATALVPHFILSLFGEHVDFVNGSTIVSSKFSLQVIIDCCAIEPIFIFTAAVIAYPSTVLQKIKGLAVIIPVFFSINIIRIVSLYYFGAYGSLNLMDKMHLEIWQVVLILFSLTIFFLWIKWATFNSTRITSVN